MLIKFTASGFTVFVSVSSAANRILSHKLSVTPFKSQLPQHLLTFHLSVLSCTKLFELKLTSLGVGLTLK